MSFVSVAPEWVSAAATDVAKIGSAISEANTAAALPTTSVLPAAADEVSARIAALFSTHARAFQRSAPRRRRFTSSSST
jgi:PE family